MDRRMKNILLLTAALCTPLWGCVADKPSESTATKVDPDAKSGDQDQDKDQDQDTAENTAPTAANQSVSVDEDASVSGKVTGDDADGDALMFSLASGGDVQHGTLTLQSDGSFTYEPDENYNGSDEFSFIVNDGTEDSAAAIVSITVNAVNDAPVGYSTAVTVDEDDVYAGNVTASDVEGDSLTYALATTVANGTLTLNSDGSFEYTPDADFHGDDQFSFKVSDGTVYSATATASITVSPLNDAPTLMGFDLTTEFNTAVGETLVGSDVDGQTLTYSVFTDATNGTVNLTANTGAFTYTPDTDYVGPDVFYVQADDGTALSNVTAVTVEVKPYIRYVKPTATGTGDGSSWANATDDLTAAAYDVAWGSGPGSGEVWVAEGTYRPASINTIVLEMEDYVDVYGGFKGTESSRDERLPVDPGSTVLSGDIDSNGFSANDAGTVVLGAAARLDGVTITGGNATGVSVGNSGSAIYQSSYPGGMTVSNAHIHGNYADYKGTIYVGRSFTLENVVIEDNTVGSQGGAIYHTFGTLTVKNSVIRNNTATSSGGGIFSESDVVVEDSAVLGNSAGTLSSQGMGGGIYVNGGTLSYQGGIVDGNTAAINDGGGIHLTDTVATISNVQISNNMAGYNWFAGAGIYAEGASLEVTHSQFIGNDSRDTSSSNYGGAIAVENSASLSVRNSSFWNNVDSDGATDISFNSGAGGSIVNTCAEDDLTSYGQNNIIITMNPFTTQAASGEYFFDPAHGCADSAGAATATTAFSATGVDWENRTSEITGLVMEGTTGGPAAGVLYDPLDVWIRSFDVTGVDFSWQTSASAESCSISNDEDSTVVQVGAEDLPSGSQVHSLSSGTVATMTCDSLVSYPKSATAVVP